MVKKEKMPKWTREVLIDEIKFINFFQKELDEME